MADILRARAVLVLLLLLAGAGLLGLFGRTGPTPWFRWPLARGQPVPHPGPEPGPGHRPQAQVEESPFAERIEDEARLPWWAPYPDRLAELRRRHGAHVLLAAFRVTLPDPLPGEEFNVALAASRLAGIVLMPGEVFSQNRMLGPYTAERGYREGPTYRGNEVIRTVGGGVCKVATALYNVATYANLEILERHPHSMRVPYVLPGRDAAVTVAGGKDLRFRNPLREPVVFWAASTARDNTLFIALYGAEPAPHVTWEHRELARRPFRVIRRPNPELPAGQERVVIRGLDGVTVHTWVVVRWPDGRVERRDRGIDRYHPLDQVVEYGPPGRAGAGRTQGRAAGAAPGAPTGAAAPSPGAAPASAVGPAPAGVPSPAADGCP